MRATIKDVAKAASVSPTTVSFIINNKPVPISEETRTRVQNAIRELDYHPNQLAVSLVKKSTNTIGMLIPSTANPYQASLSHLVCQQFMKKNRLVITGTTDYDPDVTATFLRSFEDRRVDGIILTQMDFEHREYFAKCRSLIEHTDIPIVSYGRNTFNDKIISSVEVDQVQIGYLATKHLLLLGHKRIGCAAGNMNLDVCKLRYEGYQRAMKEFYVQEDTALIYSGDFSIQGGEKAFSYLQGQNVSAIFAFSDMIAYGVYKQCKNYHVRIPEDLSIVGVDDLEFSEIINPPLTVIAQPLSDIAKSLVDTMMNKLQDPHVCQKTVLNSYLKIRGSTCEFNQ